MGSSGRWSKTPPSATKRLGMFGFLQGAWSHYTSTDLLRWTKGTDTNFTYLTGSVSPTSTGVYAFYPTITQSSIAIAVAGRAPTRSCTH